MMRPLTISALLTLVASAIVSPQPAVARADKEVVRIETHDHTTTRYVLAYPKGPAAAGGSIALVLLTGGSGFPDLDDDGRPQALKGNSLVRSLNLFHDAGFITALVDAPSDHHGSDGLAGFRITTKHADDLGRVILDVRRRTKSPVWLVGTSRGTISAVNAAARLTGPAAPDGLVLTSALMSGQSGARKAWVAQTVFDLPLEAIRIPILVIGHAADTCVRSPAHLMEKITERTNSSREQIVTVTGGPVYSAPQGIAACEGRSPHGFIGQEAQIVGGVARFIRGGETP